MAGVMSELGIGWYASMLNKAERAFQPRWSPEISAGQVLQSVIVFIQGSAILIGGLWFAFSIVGDMQRRIDKVESSAKEAATSQSQESKLRDQEQAGNIALLDRELKNQLTIADSWRAELREQLKAVNEKLEASNKALNMIQLSLANKVDRKP